VRVQRNRLPVKNTGSGNPADISWPVRERDHTRFTFSRPYRNICGNDFFVGFFSGFFIKKYRRKNQCQKFSFRKRVVKKVFARLFTQGNVLYVGDASGMNHLVRLRLFLCTKKMNFLWNLKAKKIMLFYGIFANGMFGEVGQKIILSKKSYRKRKQKNCFLIVSGMCCEVNTLGALKQHQGLDSSSLKYSSSICVRRVRSEARKRLPCGKRATRAVECHRSRVSFRRRFFCDFLNVFHWLVGLPQGTNPYLTTARRKTARVKIFDSESILTCCLW